MVHLEGEKLLSLAPAALWAKLTDLNFLVTCIPDVGRVVEVKDRTAVVTVQPGFSFVRGEIQLTLEKLEESPPDSARFLFKTKGIGSSSEVETAFTIAGTQEGSKLHWTADLKQVGGLLKAAPQGLLQAAAQKVMNDLWTRLEARLQE
jgi:carbon monoxide dehydrogenase subunit G